MARTCMTHPIVTRLMTLGLLALPLAIIPLKMDTGGEGVFAINTAFAGEKEQEGKRTPGTESETTQGQDGMMNEDNACQKGQPCIGANTNAIRLQIPDMGRGSQMEHEDGSAKGRQGEGENSDD